MLQSVLWETDYVIPCLLYTSMFVDNAAMKMLQDPCFFDVMVTENTFGDILTDEGSVISEMCIRDRLNNMSTLFRWL